MARIRRARLQGVRRGRRQEGKAHLVPAGGEAQARRDGVVLMDRVPQPQAPRQREQEGDEGQAHRRNDGPLEVSFRRQAHVLGRVQSHRRPGKVAHVRKQPVRMIEKQKRWLAFYLLCAGEFMIVIDTTIINVALPSIQADLAFSEAALVWVVNAYMVTYGGFLLLGGRLGDFYGQRRLFIAGTALFTVASLVCGLSNTRELLVGARAVQGLGGAVVSAIALSLIMNLFSEAADRAKAMGIYGFICAGGGSVGVLAGGLLTSTLSWHWVFLVNLPIGALVCALCFALLAPDRAKAAAARLDVWGAITVTPAATLAVYAIVNGNFWLLAVAAALFAAFIAIEARVRDPLMPLR